MYKDFNINPSLHLYSCNTHALQCLPESCHIIHKCKNAHLQYICLYKLVTKSGLEPWGWQVEQDSL